MGLIRLVIYVAIFVFGFILGIMVHSTYQDTMVKLSGITGNAVSEESGNYTWTTAVCNDKNECIDVLIECSEGQVMGISPVSNLTAFDENWTDPRNVNIRYC